MQSRRFFLKHATLGAVVGCACCMAAGVAAADDNPHWTYEGADGPDHWGELTSDFKTCQIGLQQTPVDLAAGVKPTVNDPVRVVFRPMPADIVNNGHTIQVNAAPGSTCTIDSVKYDLIQFHFHHPSEHLLTGKRFEMEVHFVHKAPTGGLAVLASFVTLGEANPAIEVIFAAMPATQGQAKGASSVNPSALLPLQRNYFRYFGSLTTPPCTEGVIWTVFKQPITASKDQVAQFAKLFANNARPIQKTNDRVLLEIGS